MRSNRLLVLCVLLSLAACGGSPGDGDTHEPDVPWVIGGLTFDGALVVDRSAVPLPSVTLGAPGFVVVWESTPSGQFFAPPLGTLYLPAGEHHDVVVALDQPIPGDAIRISVHADDPADVAFTASNTEISSTKDRVMQTRAGVPIVATVLLPNLPASEPNRLEVDDPQTIILNRKLPLIVTVERSPKYVVVYDANGNELGHNGTISKGPAYVNVSLSTALAPSNEWQPVTAKLFEGSGGHVDFDAPVLALDGVSQVSLALAIKWCGGQETKTCDPNDLGHIYWADACGNLGSSAGPCGSGFGCKVTDQGAACVDTDTCPGNATTYCDSDDLSRVYWSDHCGAPNGQSFPCGATSACVVVDGQAQCKLAPSCQGNSKLYCDPTDPTRVYWLDKCGQPNGNSSPCGATSTCTDADGEAHCALAASCQGNTTLVCDPNDPSRLFWLDKCGQPNGSSTPCGATSACVVVDGQAQCKLAPACQGNTTLVCDPQDRGKLFWLDKCGARSGSSIPCGGQCDDSSGVAECRPAPSCAGLTTTACDASDPHKIFWLDRCGAPAGSFIPCGDWVCDASDGTPRCTNPDSCQGNAELACDPQNPGRRIWLDQCGLPNGSSLACTANTQCSEASGEANCVAPPNPCAGPLTKICLADEPSSVFFADTCGVPTGASFPCGTTSGCTVVAGVADCTRTETCADDHRLVCDPQDASRVLRTNGCGDDLGVFKTCANGKSCVEATPGSADCACTPSDDVWCQGTQNLYTDNPLVRVDSCGNYTGEVVDTCGYGEICWYDDREARTGAHCQSSVNDTTSPYWHKGCTFVEYLDNPTDLLMDCRCRLDIGSDPTKDPGPIDRCWPIGDAWNEGVREGAGPHLHHLTFGNFYGGAIDKNRHEIFVPFQYTDSTHQNAGMVVAFNYQTAARRIVSGDYPDPQGGIIANGSGYQYDVFVSGSSTPHQHRYITRVVQDDDATGTLYTFGSNGLDNVEIVRVDPDTGARTLVWAREREGTTPSPFGQCYSELPNAAFPTSQQPLQFERRAFAKDANDNFYLAYIGGSAGKSSGDGIVEISADGSSCTIISAWNPGPDTTRSGPVGSGFAPQHGTIQGMFIKDGGIYAHHWIAGALVRHDLVTGNRTVVSNVDGSVGTGDPALGQSNFFWDATRSLLMTSGSPAPHTVVAVDLATGNRQFVLAGSKTSPLVPTVYDVVRLHHGVMINGNVTSFGTVLMDPDDNDILFMTMEGGGLAKLEISTGNSYIFSL